MAHGKSVTPGEPAGGAGGHSIAGYEYQIDVSVWLALDLVLGSRMAGEIVLEPATEEDLEADLEPNEPGRLASTARMDGYRLIVQAKRRSGDAWTVSDVKALLDHGKVRASAKQRLTDPSARYLLVTSAGLNGETRGLRVRRAGSWPVASAMPVSIKKHLSQGAAGRVAIIGNQDEERLATDIRTLLMDSFRVPKAQLDQCVISLRQEARVRILGAGKGRWTRGELEQVIKMHDGYIASSPELDQYVHPTNWQELRTKMSSRSAALIIGQSGTGKTMATRKLFEELRAEIPGLSRVPITMGPEQLRDDQTASPVLYDIEDPWGRYDFDPGSRPWNDHLSQYFAYATHDRMVVATTRLDVAQSAGVLETVKPWMVGLEAEHYGPSERRRLYRARIDALPREMQAFAMESERTVLAELATPLEIQKFFDALPTIDGDVKKSPAACIREAISSAHENSIERTVIDQIEQRGDVRAAVVIWAFLKAADKLSLRLLWQIEELLSEKGPQFERGITPLVSFFVAARNLRQVDATIAYYHPRVEAGIEKALLRNRLVVRSTLNHLIEILVSASGPGEAWGAATAARVIRATDRVPDLKPVVSALAHIKVDAWLAGELERRGKALEDSLQLAASAGSPNCNLAEAARFLLHRPESGFMGLANWGAPSHEESWYVRMRADPAVKSLAENFIRDLLPENRDTFTTEFVTEVERFAPGLTNAYLEAAARAVPYGCLFASAAIVGGALADIAGFEMIVDKAVKILTPNAAEIEERAQSHLDLVNEVYSEDYAEHLASDDSGYTAHEFLEAYVNRVRQASNWKSLQTHRHMTQLLPYWLRSLSKDESPDPEEVAGAFSMGYASDEEHHLWCAVTKAGPSTFKAQLFDRVIDGHQKSSVRLAALECMVLHKAMEVREVVNALTHLGRGSRIIEIALEIGELMQRKVWNEDTALLDALVMAAGALEPRLREISDAAALETGAKPSLSKEAIDLLAAVQNPSEQVRSFRVRLDRYFAVFVPDDVRWLLAEADEVDDCVEAIESAIRHAMNAEINAGLSHRYGRVVAHSLRHVATPLTPPLPEPLLALGKARSSTVRRALVEVLQDKPCVGHMPTLLQLAEDDWSRHASYRGEDDNYPIAQAAIAAIAKFDHIEGAAADDLYRIALKTRDPDVRLAIFKLLVDSADMRFQEDLFGLAVNPGRSIVRLAAMNALLTHIEKVATEIVALITPELIQTRMEGLASRLLLLAAARGEMGNILPIAEALATNLKRRVLLLLAIWALPERDAQTAQRIANMLPVNHVGVQWALAGGTGRMSETALDDLGDPICVTEVLKFMQPTEKRRH